MVAAMAATNRPLQSDSAWAVSVSNAKLPAPLRRFGASAAQAPALQVTFPPEGARLAADARGVPLKLRGGVPPFTLLADGAVLATQQRGPEFLVPLRGPGFTTLSVIDATGQAGRVSIELR